MSVTGMFDRLIKSRLFLIVSLLFRLYLSYIIGYWLAGVTGGIVLIIFTVLSSMVFYMFRKSIIVSSQNSKAIEQHSINLKK